jgi:hypothetical protein
MSAIAAVLSARLSFRQGHGRALASVENPQLERVQQKRNPVLHSDPRQSKGIGQDDDAKISRLAVGITIAKNARPGQFRTRIDDDPVKSGRV